MNNEILKLINSSDKIVINFSDIKDKITIQPKKKEKLISKKKFKYSFAASLIILLIFSAVFIPTKIYNQSNNQSNLDTVTIYINEKRDEMVSYICSGDDDWFFAFGPLNNTFESKIEFYDDNYENKIENYMLLLRENNEAIHFCSIDFILKTNMLSEEDKEVIMSNYDINFGIGSICNIYMGNRDGKDLIWVTSGGHPMVRKYTFESNLNCSFREILNEFENKIGEPIDQDFLNNKNSGIYVDFEYLDDCYYVKFYTKIGDTEYVVTL